MKSKNNSRIMVGVTCQCQKPAIARPPSGLSKVQCKKCGKIFKTNRDPNKHHHDTCFKCRKRR